MAKTKILMETTDIESGKTAGEIMALLGKNGAKQILSDYEAGEVVAISFLLQVGEKEMGYRLPIRWEAVLQILLEGRDRSRFKNPEAIRIQAKRIAWRIILRWLQAQIAFIQTEMVSLPQLMLPFALLGEETFYEKLARERFQLLPAP